MSNSFERFGSSAAILTGILSIVYAVLYLGVTRVSAYTGVLGSWVVLAVSGLLSAAAFIALYLRLRRHEEGYSLYALLLGVMASFAMIQHGGFEAISILQSGALGAATGGPSQVDAAGLASFGVMGIAALFWGGLIVRTSALPRTLGYVGILNGVLLIVLFLARVFSVQQLILLSGGLTSVIVGPVWWIWLGRALVRPAPAMVPSHAPA